MSKIFIKHLKTIGEIIEWDSELEAYYVKDDRGNTFFCEKENIEFINEVRVDLAKSIVDIFSKYSWDIDVVISVEISNENRTGFIRVTRKKAESSIKFNFKSVVSNVSVMLDRILIAMKYKLDECQPGTVSPWSLELFFRYSHV